MTTGPDNQAGQTNTGSDDQALAGAARATIRRRRIDPAHTDIGFRVRKMGMYYVKGRFRHASGWVEIDEDGIPRAGEVEIEAASIDTRIPPRDWHLRTRDFLDAARHRVIRAKVDAVHVANGAFRAPTELSVRGTSGTVELHGHLHPAATASLLHLHGSIDRHAFGIRPRRPLDWIVGREVEVDALVALER